MAFDVSRQGERSGEPWFLVAIRSTEDWPTMLDFVDNERIDTLAEALPLFIPFYKENL